MTPEPALEPIAATETEIEANLEAELHPRVFSYRLDERARKTEAGREAGAEDSNVAEPERSASK